MKKLIIIDPNVSITSPSMRGVVLSLPALKARDWHIEVWCWQSDPGLPIDHLIHFRSFAKIPTLGLLLFTLQARWHQLIHGTQADVIFTLASYLPRCDIALVQFSPFDWEKRQRQLGIHSLRDLYERLTNLLSLCITRRFLRRTTAKLLLPVSAAVAADLLAENPRLTLRLLPNCYDPSRFHPGTRDLYRCEMRQKLHYTDSHHVFIFVSAGHYRRKGLHLAFRALQLLRLQLPGARLLVIGGTPARLTALQTELGGSHDWITFTGMVPDVERYFAAADAFLFPSYSEAFALVEVEAAACGLPLFLTPHHGSEMILEDGINGREIEFDPAQISKVLAEFVTGLWQPQRISLKHAIDAPTYAQRLGDLLLASPVSLQTQ